ncbi:MAG: NUDIX domain-containing protein [Candidatus Moranbacteria bacterium]|nr:NUDIX domain-containing protein [Candidatus Moranbacteria bacterium]
MQLYLAVKGLVRNKEGKILVVQRSVGDDHKPGVWETPGGGVDQEEAPQKALEREIKEETGLDVIVGDSINIFTFRKDTGEFKVGITFLCDLPEGTDETSVVLSPEHSEYRWVAAADFQDLPSIPSLYQEIAEYAKKYEAPAKE